MSIYIVEKLVNIKSTFRFWLYLKIPTHVHSAHHYCAPKLEIISLRLLALILCSNCSNTFNKVLTTTRCHTVKLLFETSSYHFSLLNIIHGWSKHFTSRYDPSTPTPIKPPNNFTKNYPKMIFIESIVTFSNKIELASVKAEILIIFSTF